MLNADVGSTLLSFAVNHIGIVSVSYFCFNSGLFNQKKNGSGSGK